jgi:hypothetical protein
MKITSADRIGMLYTLAADYPDIFDKIAEKQQR